MSVAAGPTDQSWAPLSHAYLFSTWARRQAISESSSKQKRGGGEGSYDVMPLNDKI